MTVKVEHVDCVHVVGLSRVKQSKRMDRLGGEQ
jgi:hypothetical protein